MTRFRSKCSERFGSNSREERKKNILSKFIAKRHEHDDNWLFECTANTVFYVIVIAEQISARKAYFSYNLTSMDFNI